MIYLSLVGIMTLEEIIAKIISARPELTKEEVLKMIKAKERSAKGFLTEKSAALSLAADLGITINKMSFRRELQIKDLVSGLSNVTVSGRVIYVFPPRRFTRSNGREGARRSIYIADGTGMIRATFWDDKATSPILEGSVDKIVRLSHVSVRRRAGGKLELNVGSRSKIEIEPPDLRDENFPPLTKFIRKIGEITGNEGMVDIIGLIERVHPLVTFKRQDGGEGKVRRIELKDFTSRITLVLWDESANLISEDHVGKYVMLIKARTKRRFDERVELHTADQTRIVFLRRKPSGFELIDAK